MSNFFVVHLNHCGKIKQIVKKEEKIESVIEFIKLRNRGAVYLDKENVESFLVNDSLDDGVYVILDGDFIKVYKLEHMVFEGYVYNSCYIMRKLTNEYELIKGNPTEL